MSKTRRVIAVLVAMGLLVAVPASMGLAGAADPKKPGTLTALEILKKCDDFHYGYTDSHVKLLTIVKDKDGNKTEIKYDMYDKGEKRLLMFHEPPDVAGFAVLVKNPDTIYIYEPEFNKVRRVAAHSKKQTMFGMDYTMDESAQRHLHKQYDVKLESEDESKAILNLKQKSGLDKAWPKIRLTVNKDKHWIAEKLEYKDSKGKTHKVEKRKGLKKLDGRWATTIMIMTDKAKKHSTTLIQKSAKYNTGLPDKMFTKRYLIREE